MSPGPGGDGEVLVAFGGLGLLKKARRLILPLSSCQKCSCPFLKFADKIGK